MGNGDKKRFQGLARAHGVNDNVRFFGSTVRAEQYYQSADIFVLPSLYETFSLVAYEAASCCLPVVATRVSGIDELVGRNEAGILVDRTPEAIASALGGLALDPAVRLRMGFEGRRRALTFTWQRSADQVIGVYRQLLPPGAAIVDSVRRAHIEPGRTTNAHW